MKNTIFTELTEFANLSNDLLFWQPDCKWKVFGNLEFVPVAVEGKYLLIIKMWQGHIHQHSSNQVRPPQMGTGCSPWHQLGPFDILRSRRPPWRTDAPASLCPVAGRCGGGRAWGSQHFLDCGTSVRLSQTIWILIWLEPYYYSQHSKFIISSPNDNALCSHAFGAYWWCQWFSNKAKNQMGQLSDIQRRRKTSSPALTACQTILKCH